MKARSNLHLIGCFHHWYSQLYDHTITYASYICQKEDGLKIYITEFTVRCHYAPL